MHNENKEWQKGELFSKQDDDYIQRYTKTKLSCWSSWEIFCNDVTHCELKQGCCLLLKERRPHE